MPEITDRNFWPALKRALGVTYQHALRSPLRLNWLTLLVVAAIVLGFVTGAGAWLAYRRVAVDEGECWRLITPLLVHSSRDHLAWNVITMVAAGIVAERISRGRYALTLLWSALAIGLGVHFGMLSVGSFTGASGTAAAVFTFILVRLSVLNWRIDPWVSIVSCAILAAWGTYEIGLWGQLTPWEAFTGRSVRGEPGHAASTYHLVGMLSALPVALWPTRVEGGAAEKPVRT